MATVVTHVRVDPDDPGFENPSKPVGPYYDESGAAAREFETTAVTTPEGEQAYRRVVPSPRPIAVVETDEIRNLVDAGATVVCGGGGGIPVTGSGAGEEPNAVGGSKGSDGPDADSADGGVAAVVDKDYTTSLIAAAVDADRLVMATDVAYAYRNFGTDDQRPIRGADAATMREALADGEFAAGSMRPKVEACLAFLVDGRRAAITTPGNVARAVDGDAGTQIRP